MSNDMPSPNNVAPIIKRGHDTRHAEELAKIRREGFREGLKKGHQDIIDWLQNAYLGPNAPDRGTPEGDAILKLARDASLHFQSKENRPVRPTKQRGGRR